MGPRERRRERLGIGAGRDGAQDGEPFGFGIGPTAEHQGEGAVGAPALRSERGERGALHGTRSVDRADEGDVEVTAAEPVDRELEGAEAALLFGAGGEARAL